MPPVPEPSSHRDSSLLPTAVIEIVARPDFLTLRRVNVILQCRCPAAARFLGDVDGMLVLRVAFPDPGIHAAEALARRMIRVDGVGKVSVTRRDPERGERYAVRLTARPRVPQGCANITPT